MLSDLQPLPLVIQMMVVMLLLFFWYGMFQVCCIVCSSDCFVLVHIMMNVQMLLLLYAASCITDSLPFTNSFLIELKFAYQRIKVFDTRFPFTHTFFKKCHRRLSLLILHPDREIHC